MLDTQGLGLYGLWLSEEREGAKNENPLRHLLKTTESIRTRKFRLGYLLTSSQSCASESASFSSHRKASPDSKLPAVVTMRSSCTDVPDEIRRRRLPRASERSTLAVVFPPACPLTLMTDGMIRFTIGCHATISAAFLPVLPPMIVVCAPPSLSDAIVNRSSVVPARL